MRSFGSVDSEVRPARIIPSHRGRRPSRVPFSSFQGSTIIGSLKTEESRTSISKSAWVGSRRHFSRIQSRSLRRLVTSKRGRGRKTIS
jgi:hypothetical protein